MQLPEPPPSFGDDPFDRSDEMIAEEGFVMR